MKNIKVTLLHHTPLYIASDGARTCWASQDKSDTKRTYEDVQYGKELPLADIAIGPKDLALIDRVGNKFHHASILEHISMNFFIDGISRACLQEVVRHRHTSLSVKSSRYTLKELKDEPLLWQPDISTSSKPLNTELLQRYCVMIDDEDVNLSTAHALASLQALIKRNISNDKAKYCMPEAYRTQLTWTINLRSLQNFLSLRTDRTALPEIQHLARLIYATLPTDIQSLVTHCIKE